MAGAGAWCLPALYYPVPFPSLIGHKASSALVYLHLSPQDFPGAPWALQRSAVIAEGSVSLVLLATALTVGSQSSMGASKRGEDAQRKAVFLLRMGFGHGGERGEQLHEGVQVGAAKEVTSPWVEMWHQPSFTLTAIKQSTGARKPTEASHQHPCPFSFLLSFNLVSMKIKAVFLLHSTCTLKLDF